MSRSSRVSETAFPCRLNRRGVATIWMMRSDRPVLCPACVWQWVGGWRVDTNSGAADVDGWCYGATAQDLLAGRGGEQGLVAKGKRRVRCRYGSRLFLRVWGTIQTFSDGFRPPSFYPFARLAA